MESGLSKTVPTSQDGSQLLVRVNKLDHEHITFALEGVHMGSASTPRCPIRPSDVPAQSSCELTFPLAARPRARSLARLGLRTLCGE